MHARFRVSGSRLDSIPFNSIRFELFKYSSEYLYSCCRIFRVGAGEGRGRECPFREDFKNYYSSGRGEALPRSALGKCSATRPSHPKTLLLVSPEWGTSVGLKTYPLVGGRNLPTYCLDLCKEMGRKHRSRAVEKHPPCLWVTALFVAISRSETTGMHLRRAL